MSAYRISPPTLLVDFNHRDPSGRVHAIMPGGGKIAFLAVGQQVRLSDEDGNFCDGILEQLDEPRALVCPIWSTWTTEPQMDDNPGEVVMGTYPEAVAIG